MGLEIFTGYINALNEDNPSGLDAKQGGDNHIRGIKFTLKTTFPNFTGAVTASNASINAGIFAANTRQLFYQQSAPTGWVADTGVHDAALRVVNAGLTGGSTNYAAGVIGMATIFGASKSTGSTELTTPQIPSHTHSVNINTNYNGDHQHYTSIWQANPDQNYMGVGPFGAASSFATYWSSLAGAHAHNVSGNTAATGSGQGHTHTLSLNLYYADMIIARKTV